LQQEFRKIFENLTFEPFPLKSTLHRALLPPHSSLYVASVVIGNELLVANDPFKMRNLCTSRKSRLAALYFVNCTPAENILFTILLNQRKSAVITQSSANKNGSKKDCYITHKHIESGGCLRKTQKLKEQLSFLIGQSAWRPPSEKK